MKTIYQNQELIDHYLKLLKDVEDSVYKKYERVLAYNMPDSDRYELVKEARQEIEERARVLRAELELLCKIDMVTYHVELFKE